MCDFTHYFHFYPCAFLFFYTFLGAGVLNPKYLSKDNSLQLIYVNSLDMQISHISQSWHSVNRNLLVRLFDFSQSLAS
jgi:hypothetical protein